MMTHLGKAKESERSNFQESLKGNMEMSRRKILYTGCLLGVVAIVSVISATQKSPHLFGQSPNDIAARDRTGVSDEALLNDKRLINFNRWSTEDNGHVNLSYVVRSFDQDPNYEEKGVKLTIFDQTGAAIYEDYFSEVRRIYPSYALRKGGPPQLILEVSDGGSDSFLEILNYQNGRVVNLTDSIKPNNSFRANVEVRPQFRRGVTPTSEPDQILLTPDGLASPGEKYTKLYRYKDGAYRYAGSFNQSDVDDYIETLITKGSVSSGKPKEK